MGKKRKTTTTVEEIPEELPGGFLPPEEDLLDRAASDLGAGLATIRVYQIGKDGKSDYVAEFAADEADAIVGEVARRFGGGKYLARFFSEEGLLERAPVRFGIAASVKPQSDEERTTRSTGGTLQERLLEKMLEKAVDGGGNPAAVTAAMIQAGSQQAAAMMGVLMPMMKQMMENAQPQRLPAEVMADMFSAGLEFAGKGGGDDRSPLALIDRFAGILEKATGARRAALAAPPQPPAAAAPLPAALPDTIEGGKPVPGWLKLLQPYLAELVQAAKDGTPASLVAAVIADRSPSVADWLAAQTPSVFIEAVSEHVPELKPHAEWMREVLTTLRDGESNGDTPDGTVPHDA